MGKFIDLTGGKYNRLTVLGRAENTGRGVAWICQCDCGNITIVKTQKLKSGLTKSCGCYQRDMMKHRNYTHGKSKERIYRTWAGMIARCKTKSATGYEHYGGRGIKVYDEWNDFVKFYEWAKNNGYDDTMSIERKDVDGNYCPENCIFIPMSEQVNNQKRTHFIEYKNEKHNVVQWAEILSMSDKTLMSRIRAGWSIDRAFNTPVQKHNKTALLNEVTSDEGNTFQG